MEHTKGVMRRSEAILKAIQEADPDLISDRDVEIAAWHPHITVMRRLHL